MKIRSLLLCLVVVPLLIISSAGTALSTDDQILRIEYVKQTDNRLILTYRGVSDTSEPVVKVGDVLAKNVGKVATNSDGTKSLEIELPENLKPPKALLEVKVGATVLKPQTLIDIPDSITRVGRQPEILKIVPTGGLERATVRITGKNLGDNIKKTRILVADNYPVEPLSISAPDSSMRQELVFAIPTEDTCKDILGRACLYRPAFLTVQVDTHSTNWESARCSNWERVNIVHPEGLWRIGILAAAFVVMLFAPLLALIHWGFAGVFGGLLLLGGIYAFVIGFWALLLPVGVTIVLLALVCWKNNVLQPLGRTLFLDKDTNTYSLSKCQAFAWTAVLIGSYIYFAIGRGLFLGKAEIPDFNASLLALMSISFGGLVVARGIGKNTPKNDLTPSPPSLGNLIAEGGSISMTRLQLVAFTVTAIIVFLYYVSSSDLFLKGLPDLPPTLNGLLGISVLGYLGGKVVDGTAVNYIMPRRAKAGETLNIFGSGFVDGTKIIVQGSQDPQKADFKNKNSFGLTLPAGLKGPGTKQLVFIPSTGSSFVIEGAFELIDPKVTAKKVAETKAELTVEGISITPEEKLTASIAGKPVEVEGRTGNILSLKSTDPIAVGAELQLETEDGVVMKANITA